MEPKSQSVRYILTNIEREFTKMYPSRRNTAFYWAVQAGNVDLVQSAIEIMQQQNMHHQLNWLLNKQHPGFTSRSCLQLLLLPFQFLLFVITFVMTLTPFFGFYHMLVSRLIFAGETQPDSDLPLFLAARSGKQQMVQLVLQQGVTLLQTDDRDRNIFHALVDYSITNSSALTMYKVVTQVYGNIQDLKRAMLKQMDRDGLTALETCAKRGSPRLLNEFFNTSNVLRQTIVTITSSDLIAADNHFEPGGLGNHRHTSPENQIQYLEMLEMNTEETQTPSSGADNQSDSPHMYQRFAYNVTEYEQGGLLGKQSLPLLLLAQHRTLEKLDQDDVKRLWESPVVSSWYALKKAATWPLFLLDLAMRIFLYGGTKYFSDEIYDQFVGLPLTAQFMSETESVYAQRLLNATNLTVSYADLCEQRFTEIGGIPFDECQFKALEIMQSKCPKDNLTAMTIEMDGSEVSDVWKMEIPDNTLTKVLVAVATVTVVYSLVTKFIFLGQSLRYTRSLRKAVRRIFAISLPGSVLDDFLLVLLCFTLFGLMFLMWRINETKEMGDQLEDLVNLANLTYYTYMISNFLSVVSTLRLMPSIGYYVVVTKKLFPVLIRFMIMFTSVMVAVALVLKYAMRDSTCALQTKPKFQTFVDSLYETYKLTFLAGDFSFDLNSTSKFLYIFYSMYGVLLLLNLIIAIMGSEASLVMTDPWKKYIWRQEKLSYALLLEVGLNGALWVSRSHRRVLKFLGYAFESNRNKLTVYIETEENVKIKDIAEDA